jgi:hypothetical protein
LLHPGRHDDMTSIGLEQWSGPLTRCRCGGAVLTCCFFSSRFSRTNSTVTNRRLQADKHTTELPDTVRARTSSTVSGVSAIECEIADCKMRDARVTHPRIVSMNRPKFGRACVGRAAEGSIVLDLTANVVMQRMAADTVCQNC